MERRELLKMIALATGGVVIGGEVFLTGCKSGAKTEAGFSTANIALLDEVGETIIPATTTPGAKAAKIGEFMKAIVTDCYTQKQQDAFVSGMVTLDEACKKANGKDFISSTPEQRKSFLLTLEKEAKDFNTKADEAAAKEKEANKTSDMAQSGNNAEYVYKAEEPVARHYYTMMKQLTLWGFFTSKTGATETLRYVAVPGKYDGALPYKKGDRAWG